MPQNKIDRKARHLCGSWPVLRDAPRTLCRLFQEAKAEPRGSPFLMQHPATPVQCGQEFPILACNSRLLCTPRNRSPGNATFNSATRPMRKHSRAPKRSGILVTQEVPLYRMPKVGAALGYIVLERRAALRCKYMEQCNAKQERSGTATITDRLMLQLQRIHMMLNI